MNSLVSFFLRSVVQYREGEKAITKTIELMKREIKKKKKTQHKHTYFTHISLAVIGMESQTCQFIMYSYQGHTHLLLITKKKRKTNTRMN